MAFMLWDMFIQVTGFYFCKFCSYKTHKLNEARKHAINLHEKQMLASKNKLMGNDYV